MSYNKRQTKMLYIQSVVNKHLSTLQILSVF